MLVYKISMKDITMSLNNCKSVTHYYFLSQI